MLSFHIMESLFCINPVFQLDLPKHKIETKKKENENSM